MEQILNSIYVIILKSREYVELSFASSTAERLPDHVAGMLILVGGSSKSRLQLACFACTGRAASTSPATCLAYASLLSLYSIDETTPLSDSNTCAWIPRLAPASKQLRASAL